MEEFLKIIFSWLGATFIVMGVICFISILKSEDSSMFQELTILGIVFSVLGIVFFIVQTILKIITSLKNKLHNELLLNGTKIDGTVEKVYLQKYVQYGNKSPYRILYTYTWQGKVYHQKSYLLWDKPNFMERDSIAVYTNDLGKSTIQL